MLVLYAKITLIYITQSSPTLCNPMDCSPPGCSVHRIFQARILEWVVTSFSRGSFPPRERTLTSSNTGRLFTVWVTREEKITLTLHRKVIWQHTRLSTETIPVPTGLEMRREVSNATGYQTRKLFRALQTASFVFQPH